VHKTVGEMVGNRPTKPAKTARYLLWIDTKNRLLRNGLFLKALPAIRFQPDGDKEARTPDPYNAIVVSSRLENIDV
jgi:hypothetical protein